MTDLAPVPPQAIEAEESILGACMFSAGSIATAAEVVVSRDFYRASHGRIFQACVDLDAAGTAVDAVTLVDELERRGELEDVGGRTRVFELAALCPSTASTGHHARIVREAALLRGLVHAGGEIARLGYERPGDVENLIDRAQSLLGDLAAGAETAELEQVADSVSEQFRRIRELAESGRDLPGLSSGLKRLDDVTGGFEPGNLIVLGGRPSLGKTALALQIGLHVALNERLPVACFTLEMSKAEVTQRLLSSTSKISLERLRRARLGAEDWPALAGAAEKLHAAPVYVDETGSPTAGYVRSTLRALKRREPGLALVVVDYLQLMAVERARGERRDLEIGDVTRALKQTARVVGVPVVLLSQLNRESERRADKRPTMADLRDSGAIEADADIVLLLHRPEDKEGQVTVVVGKNRNGPTDDVTLGWRKETTRFMDEPQAAA